MFKHQNSEIAEQRQQKYSFQLLVVDLLIDLVSKTWARLDDAPSDEAEQYIAKEVERAWGVLIDIKNAVLWGKD